MFGIGLPEMLLILALALIVVGPDKLPDLARSVAKGIMELKKTADGFKDSMEKEGDPLAETKKELEEAATELKSNLLNSPSFQNPINDNKGDGFDEAKKAYQELLQNKVDTSAFIEIEPDDSPAPITQEQDTTPSNSLEDIEQQDKDTKNGKL